MLSHPKRNPSVLRASISERFPLQGYDISVKAFRQRQDRIEYGKLAIPFWSRSPRHRDEESINSNGTQGCLDGLQAIDVLVLLSRISGDFVP